jgi:hypothetical protein
MSKADEIIAVRRTFDGILAIADSIEGTGITDQQRKLILSMCKQIYRLAMLLAESKRITDIRLFEGWDEDERRHIHGAKARS